jgi:hypothetical protein
LLIMKGEAMAARSKGRLDVGRGQEHRGQRDQRTPVVPNYGD